MNKGQGGIMQVMIAVLIVAILGLFLFVTQTSTTVENIADIASTSQSYQQKITALSIYDISFIVIGPEKPRVAEVLAYACEYGKPTKKYHFVISDDVPVSFEPQLYLENYLNQTVPGKYYFYMDCNENKPDRISKTIEAGTEPPDDQNVIVSSIEIPLARDNRTKAYLYRWQ